jgi:hypothetical protein
MYHATYRAHLDSILEWGLGGAREAPPKNYEDSESGVVYLATSPEVAISYAETSDVVPEAWLDDIVLLRIDMTHIDKTLVQPDKNVRLDASELPYTYEYRGTIPPFAIEVVPD